MKSFKSIKICIITAAMTLILGTTIAQEQAIYAVVSFIKSSPDVSPNQKDFLEAYKKVQMQKIENGELSRWAFYKVANRNGSNDDYNYVSASFFQGNKQLASNYSSREISKYFQTLSEKEIELIEKTNLSSKIAFEEVHLMRDLLGAVSGFPEVMWMQYFKLRKGKKMKDLLELDRNLNASSFQENIKNDHLLTFQTYQQVLPSGSEAKADLVRLFGFNDFEHMLNFPIHNDMAFFKENPSFAKVDFTLGVTSLVKEEAWQLLECSCDK